MSAQIAKRDSQKAAEVLSHFAAIADAGSDETFLIELAAGGDADYPHPFLRLRKVDAAGNTLTGAGEVTVLLDLNSITDLGLTSTPLVAKFRKITWKDKDTCAEYQAAVLMTQPEPAP